VRGVDDVGMPAGESFPGVKARSPSAAMMPRRRRLRGDETVPGDDDSHRMPSHDAGMVGLVKRLIDHAASQRIWQLMPGRVGSPQNLESPTVLGAIVVLRKRGD
jgi:hypothetical protein